MKIDLKALLDGREFAQEFNYEFQVNLEETFGVGKPGTTTIKVTGTAQNTLGYYKACLHIQFVLQFLCDRCLSESQKEISFSTTHEFSLENLEEKDESAFISPDNMLDIDLMVLGDIGLELPSKLLCKEDCKGICPICGKNKNETDCNCEKDQIDPRLEALKQFLK